MKYGFWVLGYYEFLLTIVCCIFMSHKVTESNITVSDLMQIYVTPSNEVSHLEDPHKQSYVEKLVDLTWKFRLPHLFKRETGV